VILAVAGAGIGRLEAGCRRGASREDRQQGKAPEPAEEDIEVLFHPQEGMVPGANWIYCASDDLRPPTLFVVENWTRLLG